MSETLIAFDFEAFKADPSRLCDQIGAKPFRASVVFDEFVAIMWTDEKCCVIYTQREFHRLRLVAKTRTIKVRLCDYGKGKLTARTSDLYDLTASHCHGDPWVGDEFEREIPA